MTARSEVYTMTRQRQRAADEFGMIAVSARATTLVEYSCHIAGRRVKGIMPNYTTENHTQTTKGRAEANARVGRRLKAYRERAKLTQRQLAQIILEGDQPTLARTEKGERRLPRTHAFWDRLRRAPGMTETQFQELLTVYNDPEFAAERAAREATSYPSRSPSVLPRLVPTGEVHLDRSLHNANGYIVPDDLPPAIRSAIFGERSRSGTYVEVRIYPSLEEASEDDLQTIASVLRDELKVGLNHWERMKAREAVRTQVEAALAYVNGAGVVGAEGVGAAGKEVVEQIQEADIGANRRTPGG